MAIRHTSIVDLAQELNLSPATISRALADHKHVSQTTRQRVRRLAQELNYQPNHLAAALRKGRSGVIGVLVPHITGHFFPEVVHAINQEATHEGYSVMICESNEDAQLERKNFDLLLNARAEGILISLACTTRDFASFQLAQEQGVPLVFFDRVPAAAGINTVVLDERKGAYELVSQLIAQGCSRIAHFTGPLHLSVYCQRHQGYREALRAHGIAFDERLVYACDMSQAAGRQGMTQLLGLAAPPDAVFTSKDTTAVGIVQALAGQGLRVPEDVAVAGFSNENFALFRDLHLPAVDQQAGLMGRTATQLLLKIMSDPEGAAAQKLVLKPHRLASA